MNVLVVGGGGREHALAWKLSSDARIAKVFAAPGSAGIAQVAECMAVKAEDNGGLTRLAEEIGAEEASGVLRLVGAEIVIEGHASATGAGAGAGAGTGTETGAGEKTLGVCRAVFVKQLLVVAGVDAARIAVEDKGASGAGEAYRHRRVVLRVE